MKNGKFSRFQRFVAIFLIVSTLLSYIPVRVYADTEDLICGLTDHDHTEQCYLEPTEAAAEEPAGESTEATTEESTEEIAEESTEEVTEEPIGEFVEAPTVESMEEAAQMFAGEPCEEQAEGFAEESTGEAVEESTEPEKTLTETLLEIAELESFYQAVFAYFADDPDVLYALNGDERCALAEHTENLYAAIAEPDEMDAESREQLLDLFEMLGGCPDCGQPDGNHTEDCPAGQKQVLEPALWSGEQKGGDYSGDIQLSGDVKLLGLITVPANAVLTIDLNGYVLTAKSGDRFAFVSNKGTLIINDSRPDVVRYYDSETGTYSKTDTAGAEVKGGIITGKGSSGLWGGAICVNPEGTLIMNGGTIANFTGHDGGAIHCAGSFTMNGGTISNNTATEYGGGLDVVGTFTMNGGTISGNAAQLNGGGVNAEGAFAMKGGMISGNHAARGGGVYASSTFEMNPKDTNTICIITGNKSTYNGGGVCVSSAFTMKGGTISYNSSNEALGSGYANGGGGVCVNGSGSFTMSGGTICDNETLTNGQEWGAWGGGVFADGNFEMTGGEIKNNESSSGGGVMVWTSTFTLNGGIIASNRAIGGGGTGNGGGVYVESGHFYFFSGTLEKNWANRYGGGININAGSKIHTKTDVKGECVIRENSANNGGGISQEKGMCTLILDNERILITENEARGDGEVNEYSATSGHGGGIFIEMGTVTLNAGTISQNTALAGGGIALHVERLAGDITFEMNGGLVSENAATVTGGGIDIFADHKEETKNKVLVKLNGGTFAGNRSDGSGGAIDIHVNPEKATAHMYIGKTGEAVPKLTDNKAKTTGGAIQMSNGSVTMYKGEVTGNTADINGGAIYVSGGNATIAGGNVRNNKAKTGSGGALYVSAGDQESVFVKLFSGILQANHAAANGGAVAVVGSNTSQIGVQIGVNRPHFDENKKLKMGFPHQDGTPPETFVHSACPVIRENTSNNSGGAFYISGGHQTNLGIFCLTDEHNTTAGDQDVHKTNLSHFMMVQGGQVIISTASEEKTEEMLPGEGVEDNAGGYGNATIAGSIHVVAGRLDLMGNMDNPKIDGIRTIDLQSSEDRYFDHRGSTTKVKINYHENFYGADGTVDSTHTALDLDSGTQHTIYTGLYVHEGYELYGWSTDKNAVAGDDQYPWYVPGTEFAFYNEARQSKPAELEGNTDFDNRIHYGDLTVYAIWKINGYFIAFDPGVPDGEKWSGSVATMNCRYNREYQLPANGFVRPGYCFTGWKLKDKIYQPDDKVLNLTSVNADTVTFVAQWDPCEHPETVGGAANLIYSVNAQGDTMTKTCHLCGLSATARISAKDAVYDGLSHYATLELTNAAFWNHMSSPALEYTGTKINSTESVAAPETCVNAGDYVASLQANGQTITASFRIDKAPQSAPASRPSYEHPSDDSNVVTIHQLPDRTQRINQASGVPVEYYLRYYGGGVEHIIQIPHGALEDETELTYELTEALKTYAVLAGYPETDNYYASPYIIADTTFLFAGKIHLTVDAEEGIDFWLGNAIADGDSGLMLYTKLWDGYYLIGEDFVFEKKLADGSVYPLENLVISPVKVGEYTLSASASEQDVYITIHISGVKKIASLSAAAKEGQHFSDFMPNAAPVIARDSAFTVRYQLMGFDQGDYEQPKLTFAPSLPTGSTIILRDRNDGSYWYFKAQSSTAEVPVSEFTRMGANTKYQVKNGDQNLQFIVDFSRVEKSLLLSAQTSVTCQLSFTKREKDSKAANVEPKTVSVALRDVTCTLAAAKTQPESTLTRSLEMEIDIGGAASRYAHRDLALVLVPDNKTPLPVDARILVNLQNTRITYRPNQKNQFVIPLGDFRAMDAGVQLQLVSDMFPYTQTSYIISARLWLSASDAESATVNGEALSASTEMTFSSGRVAAGLKILEENDKRLFRQGDQITVSVVTMPEDLLNNYLITVQLHQKFPDGTFGNTALQPGKDENRYTFRLNTVVEGSYCVVATLSNSDGYILDEAKYYFILQQP